MVSTMSMERVERLEVIVRVLKLRQYLAPLNGTYQVVSRIWGIARSMS